MSLLTDLYNDIPSSLRKWIFVGLIMFAVGMLSAWTINLNHAVNSHLAAFDSHEKRLTALESEVDSVRFNETNQFKKIERYLCYNNKEAAILSGLDCPIQ